MTLLEPWVLFRLAAGILAMLLFAYGAWVGARILRYAHVEAATEGRLVLERQFELAATLVRVGAAAQLSCVLLSILAADRLSGVIRGAMCGYGVVQQNVWGWTSMSLSLASSLAAGVLLQLFALDRRVRGLDLMRPLAALTVVMAGAPLLDLVACVAWLGRLDLSATASCCSTTLDSARREGLAYWQGPRIATTWGALFCVTSAIGAAMSAHRQPRRAPVTIAGGITLVALPLSIAAVILEVAPHIYEVPEHLCPFCLFKADAYFIGYPLLGAVLLAGIWGLGSSAAASLSSGPRVAEAFPDFARSRMLRQAIAWALALVLGAAPVAVYTLGSRGASLFR